MEPQTAEECFATLAKYLQLVQMSIRTAPISPEEKGKLGGMIAAYFFSTSVDVCLGHKPNSTAEDLDSVIENLVSIITTAARNSKKMVLNG